MVGVMTAKATSCADGAPVRQHRLHLLLVSGGHCQLLLVAGVGRDRRLHFEPTLMSGSSSLFGRINSLFPEKYSLFQCVGNLVRKLSDCSDLRNINAAGRADFDDNSL